MFGFRNKKTIIDDNIDQLVQLVELVDTDGIKDDTGETNNDETEEEKTNDTNDTNDTDDTDDTDDTEEEEDTDIFVVSIDGIANCYSNTEQEAREKMWKLARIFKHKFDSQYNTYICQYDNANTIEIIGFLKFSIISIDRTINLINVHRVYKIKTN